MSRSTYLTTYDLNRLDRAGKWYVEMSEHYGRHGLTLDEYEATT